MSMDGDNIVRGRIRRLAAVRGHPRKACEPKKEKEKEEYEKLFHKKMLDPLVDEHDDIVLHDDVIDE